MFSKKKTAGLFFSVLLTGSALISTPVQAAGSWIKDGSEWRYTDQSGTALKITGSKKAVNGTTSMKPD